jgi:polysaccharide biosynthesis protein PslH
LNILFVSLFLPQKNAYHAGGKYVFEVIRDLSGRHDIHLVTRLEKGELPLLESLRPYCKAIHPYTYNVRGRRKLTDLTALGLNYIGFSRFADRIASSGHFDLIHVEWVDSGIMIKKRRAPMLLTAHDVITKPVERRIEPEKGPRKMLNYLIYRAVRAVELRIANKFDIIFTLSEYDREYLSSMNAKPGIRVMPYPAGIGMTDRTFRRQEKTILFLASYKYLRRNTEAALFFHREIFPLVRKAVPEARFIAAGYGPPPDLMELQKNDPAVSVPGFVDDIEECYKTASVFVAPILVGGGIIVKVLDALAAGTPVVTTTFGNEGVGAETGKDILVADNPEDFAAAVIRVLTDRKLAEALSFNGKEFARKNFSHHAAAEKLESAYRELVNREP